MGTYDSERNKKYEHAKKLGMHQWEPLGAWSYGFHEGWHGALNSEGDRELLFRWYVSSKHIFCPCTEKSRCDHNCPHGLSIMSGVCHWCLNAMKEIESEINESNMELQPNPQLVEQEGCNGPNVEGNPKVDEAELQIVRQE